MAEDLFQDPDALKRLVAYDRDGRRIGDVAQVYVDYWSRRPEWLSVRTQPHHEEDRFVPLEGAVLDADGELRLAYTVETVSHAPRENADQHLTPDQEQELYAHYGLTRPQDEASGAPGIGDGRPKAPLTGAPGEVAQVRELMDQPPAEHPRLRKFVPADTAGTVPEPSGAHLDNG